MTEMLNWLGAAAWGPVAVFAIPLAIVGLMVRATARRQAETIALTLGARRQVASVTSGLVTVEGTWRPTRGGDGRGGDGLVEDASGAAVLITRDADADAITDGTPVLVVGCAGGVGDDPRGSGYRGHARLPRIVACGLGHFVSSDRAMLDRGARSARLRATVGAALFALAISIAAAAMMVAWRATE
ncbi:MAG: hypothetical protein JWN44_6407 [Myxococcales bacterium]|nr:hypothetical protein [Myxococcales bacterium]